MNLFTQKLLSISSPPVVQVTLGPTPDSLGIPEELKRILSEKNGLYAFYGSLHFYPLTGDEVSIETMNTVQGWKDVYPQTVRDGMAFACDAFGDQYIASTEGGFLKLEIETGSVEPMGNTLEECLGLIFSNLEVQTGYPLALQWQEASGPIPHNHLLSPKIPFMLGGPYTLDNLWLSHVRDRVEFASDLFKQTRDLPDGQQIKLVIK